MKYILIILLTALGGVSCSEAFLDVPVTATATSETVQKSLGEDPAGVLSMVNAAYTMMVQLGVYGSGHDAFGYMAILHATDMMAEDIVMSPLHWFNFDYLHDNRTWTQARTAMIWGYFYTVIATANRVLELTQPDTESPDIRAARGQALALRAFSYLYLVQLYQHVLPVVEGGRDTPGVPLYFAANEGKESVPGRASVKTILKQIKEDLGIAIDNLQGWQRTSKNQIDQSVAYGLLARYHLLTAQRPDEWAEAAAAAKAARANYEIMTAAEIFDGFMNISNAEWMWGFDHNTETTTFYGSFFSHISNLTAGYAGLGYAARLIDRRLYHQIPQDDARQDWFQGELGGKKPRVAPAPTAWTWEKMPYANLKFGDDGAFTMDYVYMRASEMALIEAEALAWQGNFNGATDVLNELLQKRGKDGKDITRRTVTVEDVWLQRRIELWGEGFAMFDLKRQDEGIDRGKMVNRVESNHETAVKVPARDARWIFQIPRSEILENPAIKETDNNK